MPGRTTALHVESVGHMTVGDTASTNAQLTAQTCVEPRPPSSPSMRRPQTPNTAAIGLNRENDEA